MIPLPDTVQCRALLADGRELRVTASRRARAGRADVKCAAPGAPAIAQRMQEVVRLARHTEPRLDSRDQVVIGLDGDPGPHDRGWELAVVLADRMVRGLFRARGPVLANGWSDCWELGRILGHTARDPGADVLLGGPDGLPHLGALAGQPDRSASVSTAHAWFPLHSGGAHDRLCRVQVSVAPAPHDAEQEECAISAPGLDAAAQHAVRRALVDARHFDGRGIGSWRTIVRFDQPRFQGRSFELALVMADRLARGREFVPRGRILATGCSDAWHAGRVGTVDGVAPKCALLLRAAMPGDRVLLPRDWQGQLPAGFAGALRERGASLACIDRIGII